MIKNIVFFPVTQITNGGLIIDQSTTFIVDLCGQKVVKVVVHSGDKTVTPHDIYGKVLYSTNEHFAVTFFIILKNNLLHKLDKRDEKVIEFVINEPELAKEIESLKYLRKVIAL